MSGKNISPSSFLPYSFPCSVFLHNACKQLHTDIYLFLGSFWGSMPWWMILGSRVWLPGSEPSLVSFQAFDFRHVCWPFWTSHLLHLLIYRWEIMSFTGWACAQFPSRVWLFVTTWTLARQPPQTMGFSKQEDGLTFPPPGDFLTQGLNPHLLHLLHCWRILYLLSHWRGPS